MKRISDMVQKLAASYTARRGLSRARTGVVFFSRAFRRSGYRLAGTQAGAGLARFQLQLLHTGHANSGRPDCSAEHPGSEPPTAPSPRS